MEELFTSQLAKSIWEKKYRVNNESLDQWLERVSNHNPKIIKLIKEKKFIFGGRILSNRNSGRGTLSNCYTIGRVPDSLEGILQTNNDIALTFKAQGGEGLSLSDIRPKGTPVNTQFSSDGIIPFMELFDKTTEVIKQGNARRGALLMSCDVRHKDIKDFITIKSDKHKINNANLSVEIPNEFMETVLNDRKNNTKTTLTQIKEYGGKKTKWEYCPTDIFNLIAEQACKYAEPGIIFNERFRHYNLMQEDPDYNIYSCNPCKLNSLCTA